MEVGQKDKIFSVFIKRTDDCANFCKRWDVQTALYCFETWYAVAVSLFLEHSSFVSGVNGLISSPNYPNSYGLMKDFYWTISVPVGKVIEITFEDLDIDGGDNCLKDYLKLYDGDDKEDTLLKSFCGNKVPQPIRSSGNKVYLHFHSDSKGTSRGFKMIWKAVDREIVVTVAPEARGKV